MKDKKGAGNRIEKERLRPQCIADKVSVNPMESWRTKTDDRRVLPYPAGALQEKYQLLQVLTACGLNIHVDEIS